MDPKTGDNHIWLEGYLMKDGKKTPCVFDYGLGEKSGYSSIGADCGLWGTVY